MVRTNDRKPGWLSHLLCAALCLILTAVLTVTALTFTGVNALTDRELHLAVAQNPAVVDAQYDRIRTEVEALTAEYPFKAETVMGFITRDSLAAYGAAAADWWLGLLKADPELEAPRFEADGLVDAVKEDELFKKKTPKPKRTSVARDKIVARVQEAVGGVVIPLRTSLISLGAGFALREVNVAYAMQYVPYLPWILVLLCLILAGMIFLLMRCRAARGLLYLGSGCAAAGLTLGVMLAGLFLLGLPGALSVYSPLLGMQLELLLNSLFLTLGLWTAGLLVSGLILICGHQRAMAKPERMVEAAA